ncbi:hypothetical protein [Burkholderia cenocepacia]|uniref:hypothetical protein n=1 Tax=Burkholderia cenocepacia TaxID=95486 RepID=UPI00222E280F|nr:hypothetical protein [Burkholderia cenocepacia]MCW3641338.1 hypothetical protein [Burkholderia cenocepacia]
MMHVSYPCTAINAWTRIRDALKQQGMAGIVPTNPKLDRSIWQFETRIDGMSPQQELALLVMFVDDEEIDIRPA